jgi:hypothetical protein
MDQIKRFHNTGHVIGRASERKLSFEQMKSVVKYSDSHKQQGEGRHGGITYRFEKRFDDEVCVVAAEVYKSECWLITGFVK